MLYCTKEDVAEMGRFGGRFDAGMEAAIASVTERFNSFIHRDLAYEAGKVELLSIPALAYGSKHSLWLEKKRVSNVRIDVSTTRDFSDPEATLLPTDKYEVDSERGKITVYGYLPRALDGVKVTYDGGYQARDDDPEAMDCPLSLRQAAVEQSIYEVNRLAQGFGATTEEETKSKIRLTAQGLLPQVHAVLLPYRRMLTSG